jgi:O-antigen biosynthesis protein
MQKGSLTSLPDQVEQQQPKSAGPADSDQPKHALLSKLEEKQQIIALLSARLTEQELSIQTLSAELADKEAQLNRITGTLGWRLLSIYGRWIKYPILLPIYRFLKSGNSKSAGDEIATFEATEDEAQRQVSAQSAAEVNRADYLQLQHQFFLVAADQGDTYNAWAHSCERLRYDAERASAQLAKFVHQPTISIVMTVCNTSKANLCKAIDSVVNQFYPYWELCICDNGSTAPPVREVLQEYASRDRRLKITYSDEKRSVAAASNDALQAASGEFVGLLDPDDQLTPDALYEVAATLQEGDADLIYSDEDGLDAQGRRCHPFFKPAWSPDLLLSCNYIRHFAVYRNTILQQTDGFRQGLKESCHYDLVLRFTEKTDKIVHIPKILYHQRETSAANNVEEMSSTSAVGRRALEEALHRRGIAGDVESLAMNGFYRVRRRIVRPGKVSIIIPTRDRLDLLARCISSIERNTDYKNYEIIIIDNGSQEAATLAYLSHVPYRVIRHDGLFNHSRLTNIGARAADGDYLLLLNNDTEVISSEWLSSMVEQAQRPEVGAVGAKLLYPDGTIQHAGVILGISGVAGHSHRFKGGFSEVGYFNYPNVIMNYSAVTGACLMMRREVFNQIGGLTEEVIGVSFNDVDLCLRLRRRGYLVVYSPHALLYHKEFGSRSPDAPLKEGAYMVANWSRQIACDPYYNPNLSLTSEDFSVDFSKPESFYCVSSHDRCEELIYVPAEDRISQQFFVTHNRLCGVAVKFGPRPVAGNVRFRLYRSDRREDYMRSVDVKASWIEPDQFCIFCFDPIPDSAGKLFYFSVQLLSEHRECQLAAWASSHAGEMAGSHFNNEQQGQALLCFKAYCLTQARNSSATPEDSGAGFGVNVAGYMTGEFGLGEATRALVSALQEVRVPYVLNNVDVSWHRNLDKTFEEFSEANPYRINLVGINIDQVTNFFGRKDNGYFKDKYNVGIWFWELADFPEEWLPRFHYYQEIWAASQFCADSLARVSPIPVVRMDWPLLLNETAIQRDKRRLDLSEDTFVFLFVFDYRSDFHRKNPLALVEAFKRSFATSENVVLVLKTMNSDCDQENRARLQRATQGLNVKIIDMHLDRQELHSLIGSCDCYVSLHRSEGLGLGMAQAMYLGKPVIATAYSGNMDFMNVNNSFLVKYNLIELEKDHGPYKKGSVWADPQIKHAAELMTAVYENQEMAAAIGQRAALDIKQQMHPTLTGKRILERLVRIADLSSQ